MSVKKDLTIYKLSKKVTQLQGEIIKAYNDGYREGFAKGESISLNSEDLKSALSLIHALIIEQGYFYPNGDPSIKGRKLENIPIFNIYQIVSEALGLGEDIETP